MELLIVVEGPTEETFTKQLLVPHLKVHNVFATPTVVTTRMDRRTGTRRKGGGGWGTWKRDITNLLRRKSDTIRVSTMIDLYGLPADFPERAKLETTKDTSQRAQQIEDRMRVEIDDRRFIPYVQRHEFEALVLAGLEQLELFVEGDGALARLRTLRNDIGDFSPEDINDGPDTHPSKLLEKAMPDYDKSYHGPFATAQSGLPALRLACPRFNGWVTALEALGSPRPQDSARSNHDL